MAKMFYLLVLAKDIIADKSEFTTQHNSIFEFHIEFKT